MATTANGVLTKDVTLGYKSDGETYTVLDNMIDFPDLGADPEKVDITVLTDARKRYMKGLQDSDNMDFTFLYDNTSATSNYRVIHGLETAGKSIDWELTFPDGAKFHFSGEVSTKVSGGTNNEAIKFVASIVCNSDITVVDPA